MENTKSEILGELIADIDRRSFELEAWKQKATLVLKRIFGDSDEKIAMVENLHYDFSSWSLRDSSGGKSSDKVKETAHKIIEAALLEVKLQQNENFVIATLKEELTGKEFAALMEITAHENISEVLTVYFSNLKAEVKDQLLAKLVSMSIGK